MYAMKKDVNEQSIALLKALADDIRLSIAKQVARSSSAVPSCDIVQSCARRLQLSQPAMSHHFKKLVEAGVLLAEKRGTENFYRYNRLLCEGHGININKL